MKRTNFLIVIVLLFLGGCATIDTLPVHTGVDHKIPAPKPQGVYHKVKNKQTIWRIAKAYDVTIAEITEANKIPNIAKIEVNQLVFIPGATHEKEIFIETDESKEDFVWPIKGKVLRYFRNKKGDKSSRGIDIKAKQGDLVRASRQGDVVFADYLPGQGYMVVLNHNDGFYTVYSKNAKLLVSLNDQVMKYDPIAHVGQEGRSAYVHFQIRKNNKEDNPLYYLP